MRSIITLSVLAFLSALNPAEAQNASVVHQHIPAKMIDGAMHPELIPDLAAYRLYLVMVSKPPNLTDVQKRKQEAQLGKINLQEPDKQALLAVLADFNYEYRNLIQTYNELATAAWAHGERSDINPFRQQRDQLVQSTHDALKTKLTAAGWGRLDAFVLSEKKHMKISAQEAGQ
jgi:hypothetical protein